MRGRCGQLWVWAEWPVILRVRAGQTGQPRGPRTASTLPIPCAGSGHPDPLPDTGQGLGQGLPGLPSGATSKAPSSTNPPWQAHGTDTPSPTCTNMHDCLGEMPRHLREPRVGGDMALWARTASTHGARQAMSPAVCFKAIQGWGETSVKWGRGNTGPWRCWGHRQVPQPPFQTLLPFGV